MALLKGKNAIITGAGSGIGRETAKLFAKEGCNLVLSGRREEPLLQVKKEIHENINSDLKILVEPTDLEKLDQAKSLGENATKSFGSIPNCAAILLLRAGVFLASKSVCPPTSISDNLILLSPKKNLSTPSLVNLLLTSKPSEGSTKKEFLFMIPDIPRPLSITPVAVREVRGTI